MIAQQMMKQGDKNEDKKLSKDEMGALAETWFDKLDADKTGKVNQEQFVAKFGEIIPCRSDPVDLAAGPGVAAPVVKADKASAVLAVPEAEVVDKVDRDKARPAALANPAAVLAAADLVEAQEAADSDRRDSLAPLSLPPSMPTKTAHSPSPR